MAELIQPAAGFDWDRIPAETFVRQIDLHRSLGSTNDRGLELAARLELDCPALVIAERQTAGRGRGGKLWWSAEGALTFSLVIDCGAAVPAAERRRDACTTNAERRRDACTTTSGARVESVPFRLTPVNRPKVSLIVGLAVCETLSELLAAPLKSEKVHVGLKWPNDVLLGGRKTCGILIEAPPSSGDDARGGEGETGRGGDRLVIGVGLNVNNSLAAAPEPVRRVATSLFDAGGRALDLTDVLIALLGQIEQGLERLTGSPDDLGARWRRYCVLRGQRVTLDVNDRYVTGACRGIDGDGALVLQTGSGTKRFFSGVVTGIGS